MRGLEPPPIARLVNGHAEAQTLFTRRSGPIADDIAMGTDVDRVPWMMLRVPGVEAIVMVGEGEK